MFKKAYLKSNWYNLFILLTAVVYSLVMIKLLFIRGRYFWDGYNYNIVPFQTIKQYIVNRHYFNTETWVKNLFGNVILFIPLGLFLPLLNKLYIRALPFLTFIILLLLAIELTQMLSRVGSFDIDDIILNTFGAVIGLCFTKIIIRSTHSTV
ncbi:VanZ family protein [Paenibacillus eucommiae]|uniref:Glycopeptide antibiotics resistance protein n=1 Tax=Paenibacillus eucommiae TaxID=1355755 RepID=A0ABS4J4Y4_9BACL|nr:VanZ family protein [Paenibacillus eucommiae]MBP1994902.1 glycopeptide antibiotics resistance protein [Paenibacillus eucommiae]